MNNSDVGDDIMMWTNVFDPGKVAPTLFRCAAENPAKLATWGWAGDQADYHKKIVVEMDGTKDYPSLTERGELEEYVKEANAAVLSNPNEEVKEALAYCMSVGNKCTGLSTTYHPIQSFSTGIKD